MSFLPLARAPRNERSPSNACSISIVLLVAVAALGFAGAAGAQAALEATVVDDTSGAPIAGIAVELGNVDTGMQLTQSTNEQGKVRFPALPTGGGYRLTAAREGSLDAEATGIVLRAGADASVVLRLRPAAVVSEAVSVTATAGRAELNSINAEVSATLPEAELTALPIEGRDLTRALYRLPNVTQATGFYPEAPNVSINGASSLYTNYLIDGLDNTENFLGGQKFAVPVGAAQDVTALTATYTAEFGRTANGVINVTSKSGSNELRGDALYLTRPGAGFDASSPFAGRDLSGNPVQDGFGRNQVGASLGGPIRQDRAFFFANVEATRDEKDNLLSSPALGVNETVRGENEFLFVSSRFDLRPSDRLHVSARTNWGDVGIERQAGGLEGGVTFPSAANTQDRDSFLGAARASFVGSSFFSESGLLWNRFRWNYAAPENDDPQASVLGSDGQTVAVLGHPGFAFDDLEETAQLQQKLTWLAGNHTLKAGAELISSDFELTGGSNPNGNYLVQLTAEQEAALRAANHGADLDVEDIPADVEVLRYDVELRPATFGERQENWSLYVEDLWSLSSRLNLSLGLRYDYDNLSRAGSGDTDDDNLAPRFAINYRLGDRSTLRAGAGVFYDKILYAVHSDALQQNTTSDGFRSQIETLIALGILPADTELDRVLFDGNLAASFTGVPYLGGPTADEVQGARDQIIGNDRRILNPNGFQNPLTEQYSLGYQRQLGHDMLFTADAIHTRGFHLFRLRDLNAPAPFPIDPADPQIRTAAEADATRPAGIVPGGGRNIVVSETEGNARYRAATLTLAQNRGGRWYDFRVSYTFSELENDTDDINFRAQDANDYDAEWGPSINDREHVLSGIAQFHPLEGLSLAVALLAQSGQPVNRIPDAQVFGTTDLNGDGRSFGDAYVGNSDRHPGEPRNSDRLPSSEVWDLAAIYRLPWRDRALELRMDVFNVFNETNLSGFSNNATQSNQIQIGPAGSGIEFKNAGPPRQFQFGVRYSF